MGNILSFARDGLANIVSRMGTDRDKAASSVYGLTLLNDAEILAAYRGAWLPRKIVDIPAFDAVRAWRNWQADGKQIEAIEAEEKRLNIKGRVLEARTKARLWGGAAIVLGTGDADLAEPFDSERVGRGGLKYLTVLTRKQLTAGEIDRDPASEWYGRPGMYQLRSADGGQVNIHPSRLVIFHGVAQADDEFAAMHQGWGDSVLQSVMSAIKQADGTAANIASLVFEAKVDIIRVPNFMQSIGNTEYEGKLISRYSLAAMGKGINGTLMLDKEEEYEQKSASFATLPEVLDRFFQLASGAADIPATRLLGQSPAGMNATGESDTRNYYDRLSAMQQLEMTPAMARMDEALIRSALGNRPPEVHYIWAPLWQISGKERAEIGEKIANTLGTLTTANLYPAEALAKAGATTLVEHSIFPGLEDALEEFGTDIPDVDLGQDDDDADDEPSNVIPLRRTADAEPQTLYVSRHVKNGADIIRWAKEQGFETTLEAADLHVTIAYSRTPVDWFKVGESWSPELKVGAGGPRQMEQFGEATVLLFSASELRWRHQEIREAGASWDHPEYQPHITISYGFKGDLSAVEPYQGEIVLGPELFSEVDEDWMAD